MFTPSNPKRFSIFCTMAQVLIREVKNVLTSSVEEPETGLLHPSSGLDIPVTHSDWPHSRKMLFPKKLSLLFIHILKEFM